MPNHKSQVVTTVGKDTWTAADQNDASLKPRSHGPLSSRALGARLASLAFVARKPVKYEFQAIKPREVLLLLKSFSWTAQSDISWKNAYQLFRLSQFLLIWEYLFGMRNTEKGENSEEKVMKTFPAKIRLQNDSCL